MKYIYSHWPEILIATSIIGSILYIILNMYWQVRATKRLEKSIRIHRAILQQKLKNKKYAEIDIKNHDEFLLMLLRNEIDSLKEKTDKMVMQKTLDRKNFNNQKRFAFKIFAESGMTDSLGLQ